MSIDPLTSATEVPSPREALASEKAEVRARTERPVPHVRSPRRLRHPPPHRPNLTPTPRRDHARTSTVTMQGCSRERLRRDRRLRPKHHLYVCAGDSRELARHLAFRDHLRADPETARAY